MTLISMHLCYQTYLTAVVYKYKYTEPRKSMGTNERPHLVHWFIDCTASALLAIALNNLLYIAVFGVA